MRTLAQRLTTPYGLRPGPGQAIGRATAALAIGAGLIHVSAAAQHSDLPAMMFGFEAVAVLQVGLGALLILGRPSRALLAAGIALMASAVLLWAVSRTVGLGFLVEGAHEEPIGFKDGVTVLFELLAITGLGLIESGPGRTGHPAPLLSMPGLGVTGAVACALFVPALLIGGHRHAETHLATTHGSASGPHLRSSHPGDHPDARGDRRPHAGRHGTHHDRSHAAGANSAPTHGHGTQLAVSHPHGGVATVAHGHTLALGPGVAAAATHEHSDGGATSAGGHPSGGSGHGTHPPGHDTGYGESPPQPPPPPQESGASGLDDVADEADKLIP